MEDKIYSGISSRGVLKLLKDFTKGCISENNEAKAEIKPLIKSPRNSDTLLIETKYSKSAIK